MRGWRKFSLSAAGLVFAFVLALLGKLTAEFSTIVAVVVAAYNTANAFSKRYGTEDKISAEPEQERAPIGFKA